MAEIVGQLPVGEEIRQALLSQEGELGDHCRLCKAQERGDWEQVLELSDLLAVDPRDTANLYLQAVETVFRSMQNLTSE